MRKNNEHQSYQRDGVEVASSMPPQSLSDCDYAGVKESAFFINFQRIPTFKTNGKQSESDEETGGMVQFRGVPPLPNYQLLQKSSYKLTFQQEEPQSLHSPIPGTPNPHCSINYQEFSFRILEDCKDENECLPKQIQQSQNLPSFGQLTLKLRRLNEDKNKLYDGCIALKKQLFKYERCKQFILDDFKQKVAKKLIAIIENERREKEKLKQKLALSSQELDQCKVRESLAAAERDILREEVEKSRNAVFTLQTEGKKLKEEIQILVEQNEEYFNQTCELQSVKIDHDERVKEADVLRHMLKQADLRIQDLQTRMRYKQGSTIKSFMQLETEAASCSEGRAQARTLNSITQQSCLFDRNKYFPRAEEKPLQRQDNLLKHSLITAKTTESPTLLKATSLESRLFFSHEISSNENKQLDSLGKLNAMATRISNLKRQVKLSLRVSP